MLQTFKFPRTLPDDVVIVPQGSLIGVVVPPATWSALSVTARYLIDLAAASHFLGDHGDYSRIVEADRWDTLAELLDLAAEDWRPAMLDGWALWCETSRPPAELHGAMGLPGPHRHAVDNFEVDLCNQP